MSSPAGLVAFMLMAIAVNALTYGGIAWVYFRDKNRVEPAKPAQALPEPAAALPEPAAALPEPAAAQGISPGADRSAAGSRSALRRSRAA